MITTLLWDVDGTLLDFLAAEEAAMGRLFSEYRLGECTGDKLKRYSQINRSYWERLENGEVTKPQVLIGRFRDFFAMEGIDPGLAEEFNEKYQHYLGDTVVYCDDSLEIVRSLRGKVKQYVVSNGTVVAQEKKLRLSGFDRLMDGVFLSEKLGVEKPNILFFNRVFEDLGGIDKREVMIVGDSLTGDVRGGNNAGIVTCWYNPRRMKLDAAVTVNYEISDLHQVFDILENHE